MINSDRRANFAIKVGADFSGQKGPEKKQTNNSLTPCVITIAFRAPQTKENESGPLRIKKKTPSKFTFSFSSQASKVIVYSNIRLYCSKHEFDITHKDKDAIEITKNYGPRTFVCKCRKAHFVCTFDESSHGF